jgi:hypothetical protein
MTISSCSKKAVAEYMWQILEHQLWMTTLKPMPLTYRFQLLPPIQSRGRSQQFKKRTP